MNSKGFLVCKTCMMGFSFVVIGCLMWASVLAHVLSIF
jgi:hypothetical protein